MKKPYQILTNINDSDFTGTWDGKEFLIKNGDSKLLPKFLADKFAEQIANQIFNRLKKDLVSKVEMAEMKSKMIGDEIVEVEIPDKTEADLLMEEIEFANNKYLNK